MSRQLQTKVGSCRIQNRMGEECFQRNERDLYNSGAGGIES